MVSKKMHFIGIGGIGMSALAEIFLSRGNIVTGSDLKLSNITAGLVTKGATIREGHKEGNIDLDTSLVIRSACIRHTNPEMVMAHKLGIPVITRSELLKQVLESAVHSCGVTGTHGKTTTSAILAHILESAGKDPTVIIGGESEHFSGNAKPGRNDLIVAEVDESDGFFRSLNLRYAVITNVEREHMENYGTMENLVASFGEFLSRIPVDGLLVYNGEDPILKKVALTGSSRRLSIGFGPEYDVTCGSVDHARSIKFDLVRSGKTLGTLESSLIGRHNVMNIMAASVMALELGVPFDMIRSAVSGFRTVKRRFNLVGTSGSVRVYEDYAHHPTEIRTIIKAAHDYGTGRVITVFQPHRHSRTSDLANEFIECFNGSEAVILTDVYTAHEDNCSGPGISDIYDKIDKSKFETIQLVPRDEIARVISGLARADDIVLVLGAGDIRDVAPEIVGSLLHGKTACIRKAVPSHSIGVLAGGCSSEREISLKSANAVFLALKQRGYDVSLIDVKEETDAFLNDKKFDTAFIAMHGRFGEDGQIQRILETRGIPYTGSGPEASRTAMDKLATKELLLRHGLPTPAYVALDHIDPSKEAKIKLPCVVKPQYEGSSVGLTVVFDEEDLSPAIMKAMDYQGLVLIESYIPGRELTVGILDNEPLPVVEIVAKDSVYDYHAKYKSQTTQYICPAVLDGTVALKAQALALEAHRALGLRGVSRVDFRLDLDDSLYILEVNTIPGMTERSLLPMAARERGIPFDELCVRILDCANKK
jgi:UDP-N-acetylmuramate--alanine ligase